MQGEAFSALRRGVAGINVLSTLSPAQFVWQRGWRCWERVIVSLSLSLSGLALEARTSSEGREEEGGASQGGKRTGSLHATPSVIVMSMCLALNFVFFLLLLTMVRALKEVLFLPSVVFIYVPSEEKLQDM